MYSSRRAEGSVQAVKKRQKQNEMGKYDMVLSFLQDGRKVDEHLEHFEIQLKCAFYSVVTEFEPSLDSCMLQPFKILCATGYHGTHIACDIAYWVSQRPDIFECVSHASFCCWVPHFLYLDFLPKPCHDL